MIYLAAFWIPGEAKSERKRQRVVTDAAGRRMGLRTDEPDRKDWKTWVRHCAREACPEPLHGPLSLTLVFVRPSPTGTNKKPTEKRPWPFAWMQKPDCSNLVKPVEDAFNGIVWVDDAQIVRLEVVKHQEPGAAPGVWVLVREATREDVLDALEICMEAVGVGRQPEAALLEVPPPKKPKRGYPQAVLDAASPSDRARLLGGSQ